MYPIDKISKARRTPRGGEKDEKKEEQGKAMKLGWEKGDFLRKKPWGAPEHECVPSQDTGLIPPGKIRQERRKT